METRIVDHRARQVKEWRALITRAELCVKVRLSWDQKWYLSTMLGNICKNPQKYLLFPPFFLPLFDQKEDAERARRYMNCVQLADSCLFFSGICPEWVNTKYIGLGKSMYSLSSRGSQMKDLYLSLSNDFNDLVRVVHEIRSIRHVLDLSHPNITL